MNEVLRDGIVSKLKEYNAYIDNELPDYIMVMLANNKSIGQVNQDLQLFLGDNTDRFTTWLKAVVANPTLLKKKGVGGDKKGEGGLVEGTRDGDGRVKKSESSRIAERMEEERKEGMERHGVSGDRKRRRVEGASVSEEKRRSGGGGARMREVDEEEVRRRRGEEARGGEGSQRLKFRKRSRDPPPHDSDESDDHHPPSPKYSKMRSDRYGREREREREREEVMRLREHHRRSAEVRSRVSSRKTIRAQPDSTRDQDLRDQIGSGQRRKEVESYLQRRDGRRGNRERRPTSEEEYEDGEEEEVDVEGEEKEEEEEEEASASSTTVSSVVRLVDSTRPRRTNEGGSRLLHRAILGLRPQKATPTSRTTQAKREKVLLLPTSMLGDKPPKKVVLTKKVVHSSAHRSSSRHDISSTHSDHSDEQEEDEEEEEEEALVEVKGREELQEEVGGSEEEAEEKEAQEDVADEERTAVQGKPISSPRVGHRIKVVTSTRARTGRSYEEEEEKDREVGTVDLRALINKSREGKAEGQSPRFVVTLGGLELPSSLTQAASEVPDVARSRLGGSPQELALAKGMTPIIAKKPIKERLGKKLAKSPVEAPPIEVTQTRVEEAEEATPTSVGDLPEKCRFWPNCKNGDKCPYHHPSIPCKLFPDCKYGKRCLFLHPKCKFDSRCTRIDCPYLHTAPRHLTVQPQIVPQIIPTPVPIPSPVYRPPVFTSNQYSYGGPSPSRSRAFRYPNKSSLSWKPPQTTSERKFAVSDDQTTSLPV